MDDHDYSIRMGYWKFIAGSFAVAILAFIGGFLMFLFDEIWVALFLGGMSVFMVVSGVLACFDLKKKFKA